MLFEDFKNIQKKLKKSTNPIKLYFIDKIKPEIPTLEEQFEGKEYPIYRHNNYVSKLINIIKFDETSGKFISDDGREFFYEQLYLTENELIDKLKELNERAINNESKRFHEYIGFFAKDIEKLRLTTFNLLKCNEIKDYPHIHEILKIIHNKNYILPYSKKLKIIDYDLLNKYFIKNNWKIHELTKQGIYYVSLYENDIEINLISIPTLIDKPGFNSAMDLVMELLAEIENTTKEYIINDFIKNI